jgi:protein Tex
MNEAKQLSPDILLHVAQSLGIALGPLIATISLLDEGGTVPFIARYRKEATGALMKSKYATSKRSLPTSATSSAAARPSSPPFPNKESSRTICGRGSRPHSIAANSKTSTSPTAPSGAPKPTVAREKGLEPIADYIWAQQPAAHSLLELAATFVDGAKGVANITDALEGARHIVVERISEHAELRKALRLLLHEGASSSLASPWTQSNILPGVRHDRRPICSLCGG